MRFLLSFIALISAVNAQGTEIPSGALVVGPSARHRTINAAVQALSTTSTAEQVIFIQPGTYKEQVYIAPRKAPLTIYGYTEDTSTYSKNQVTITAGHSQDDESNDDMTGTVRAHSDNFKMYNINMVNSRGSGSQAMALSAYGNHQGYYACSFKGFQDTVLSQTGQQVFAKSLIEGATDFIFGQQAQSWFEGCDIRLVTATLGYVTASGRSSASNPSYYVLNECSVAAADGADIKPGAFYLGRPWNDYARVAFQHCQIGDVINGAGWAIWETSKPNTDHVSFGEFGNSGPGARGNRASFSKKLSSPVSTSSILGSGYSSWVDMSYFGQNNRRED